MKNLFNKIFCFLVIVFLASIFVGCPWPPDPEWTPPTLAEEYYVWAYKTGLDDPRLASRIEVMAQNNNTVTIHIYAIGYSMNLNWEYNGSVWQLKGNQGGVVLSLDYQSNGYLAGSGTISGQAQTFYNSDYNLIEAFRIDRDITAVNLTGIWKRYYKYPGNTVWTTDTNYTLTQAGLSVAIDAGYGYTGNIIKLNGQYAVEMYYNLSGYGTNYPLYALIINGNLTISGGWHSQTTDSGYIKGKIESMQRYEKQ